MDTQGEQEQEKKKKVSSKTLHCGSISLLSAVDTERDLKRSFREDG